MVESEIFLVGLGVRPNVDLAAKAGLSVNRGIIVDEFMRTSDPNIYAAGDVCETKNLITGERQVFALAGPANKQGRVAGGNAMGIDPPLTHKGSLGTAIVGFGSFAAGMTGLTERMAAKLGFNFETIVHTHLDHVGYYPGAHNLLLKLVVNKEDDSILGAQVFGQTGVDKRVDVIATAIAGNVKAEDLADLDLSYAPQFGAARDPVIQLGLGYDDVRRRGENVITAAHFFELSISEHGTVIDVRTPAEYARGHLRGAINIPLETIRESISTKSIPSGPLFVYCAAGFRAYLCCRILHHAGVDTVQNIEGGWNVMALPAKKHDEIEKTV